MATTYKVLGQSNPSATTLTTLYTVPAATSAVCSTIAICNTAATAATVRVAIRPAGASITTAHYLVYDTSIAANDTVLLTVGVSLATTDVVSVYASSSTVVFQLFGAEVA